MAFSLSPQSPRVFRNTFTALLSGSLDQTSLLRTVQLVQTLSFFTVKLLN